MRILIIGGTGTISTSTTRLGVELGHEIWHLNRGNKKMDVPTLIADRNSPDFISAVRDNGPWDAVIEMICYRPEQAVTLLEATKGVTKRVVFCSTVDVYGHPSVYPVVEEEPRTPLSDYARNKIACEDFLMEAHHRGEIDLTIIRPACTYSDNGPLVHTFGWGTEYIDRLQKGKKIVVHGDGNSIWCSCHADDIAPVFINACHVPAASGRAYHATGFRLNSWNQYHHTIAKAIGAPEPTFVHIPSEILVQLTDKANVTYLNFQYSSIFDCTAAKRDLGYDPKITLDQGALRAVRSMTEQNRIVNSDVEDLDDRIIAAWHRAIDGISI